MKEFEQALKRARSMLGDDPQPADAKAPLAEDAPTPPPEIDGMEAFSAAPTPLPSQQATDGLPLLQADVAAFRENFGASGCDSRSVDSAFRILRTQVLDAMKDRGGKVLGITSPVAGAGKTVTSIHLAMACARRAEQTVVLADFDFRRPSIAQYLDASGFNPSLGYFRGDGEIADYLSVNETGNLQYLLTDRATDMSAEYLSSSRMDKALDTLSGQSSDTLVIADLPPVTGCDDTLAIMPKLDGLVLVVAAGENSFTEVEHMLGLVPRDKIIATVLNKVEGSSVYYEYY